jgi:integrase
MMSAGLIDRAIDQWEAAYGRSTVKNTIAALVLVLDEAVRDGLLVRNPAKDRARRRVVGRSAPPIEAQESPRDFALPDVGTLSRLVEEAVQRGGHQACGDCVTILATTALRISEVAGLQVCDVDLLRGRLAVRRQTYPGRGGLVTKETKGRRRRPVPIIDPLRATLERLTVGRARDARLLVGPRGGVITAATLRDATGWDELVDDLGLAGLVRHSLRHTALPLMADVGVDLHILQRVAAYEGPVVTARYLHSRRTGQAGRWKCVSAGGLWLVRSAAARRHRGQKNAG